MTTFDNRPPLEDWQLPPRLHCGEWHHEHTCPVCREHITIPPNIELGAE